MHKYSLDHLHPTTPRFFSRMDGAKPAKVRWPYFSCHWGCAVHKHDLEGGLVPAPKLCPCTDVTNSRASSL